ncbi:hypothetical protein NC652_035953 [Populus alba x Populus x berolinensis]|nr:hypothetical protein NC652_035953 [Populus alba x Populus x berolinensis]
MDARMQTALPILGTVAADAAAAAAAAAAVSFSELRELVIGSLVGVKGLKLTGINLFGDLFYIRLAILNRPATKGSAPTAFDQMKTCNHSSKDLGAMSRTGTKDFRSNIWNDIDREN